jgi:Amidases related to nicotinamidase
MKKPELLKALMIERDDAIVAAIDFQEHIVPAMHDDDELIETAVKFIKGARALNVPVLVTQQYTKGLGETVEPIKEALGEFTPIEKNTFSALLNDEFRSALETSGKETVILIGIEAHVCVEQTALALLQEGYNVFVISDCIESRHKNDKKMSERRMTHAGAVITTYEAALFEMMDGSKTPGFKEISAIVK